DLEQVIAALFPVPFRNGEQNCVVNLSFDTTKNMHRHPKDGVAHDLPSTRLPEKSGSLGKLPTLLDLHDTTPVVDHVAVSSSELPNLVLPVHEHVILGVHPVAELLCVFERKPRLSGQGLVLTAVVPSMSKGLGLVAVVRGYWVFLIGPN